MFPDKHEIIKGIYPENWDALDEYAKQVSIDFLFWKSKKGYYVLGGASQHTRPQDKLWIRQENQLIFSNPISTEELFELYLKNITDK